VKCGAAFVASFIPGALGADPAVEALARRYLLASAMSFPFLALYGVHSAYMLARERPRPLLVATAVANLVHLVLAVLLVFGFGLGPLAVGVTTSLSFGALALVAASLDRQPRRPMRRGERWSFLAQASPRSGEGWLEGSYGGLLGLSAAQIGVKAAGAHAIGLVVAFCGALLASGIGWVCMIDVAAAWAGGERRRAADAVRRCLIAVHATSGVLALAQTALAGPLARAIATSSAALADLTRDVLAVCAVLLLFEGTKAVAIGALRGLDDARTSLGLAFGSQAAGLAAAWWMSTHGGSITSIWWSMVATYAVLSLLHLAWFAHQLKRT
jgi:MATE family multidrug resistance protein